MKFSKNLALVESAFERTTLARVCELDELDFPDHYDLATVEVAQRAPENFYYFQDNGSSVLAVAHLDTVGLADERAARFVDTEAGPVVFSRALDDRLGAYIILELLPALGIEYDVLLTVGEETGQSTAHFFEPEKQYDWLIEFDRGGTDVVMYQYDDDNTRRSVRQTGAQVGDGIFSDISYMEHVGVKGFNWGVGYRDYHGPRAHAYLDDTFEMVARYLKFHQINSGVRMPHAEMPAADRWRWCDLDDDEGDPEADLAIWDDRVLTDSSDLFDDDFIENPTQEQMRAWESRIAEEYLSRQRI